MKRPLWFAAANTAHRAHAHQLRRDGATPYAAHPSRVVLTLSAIFGVTDEEVLAAAFLHDVIEDTSMDYDDIEEEFGRNVADFVAVMTKDMRRQEPERERDYDDGLAKGPWQGRLIKLADAFDNLQDARMDGVPGGTRSPLAKARRILELTLGDEELAMARGHVEALVAAAEAEAAQARS